jgi:endonuclease YncB( thermonuclease family)
MKRHFVLALLLTLLLSADVAAATLFGRVVEVNDGDVITVFNLNRPVRVKILAVDAPEANQAFGELAKKHLSDLVYDKSVLVEYWGIAADGSLVGRVTLNNTDIGAQMIRDGAAWFDASNQSHLSANDREVYQQSQLAARSERRGLWQADDPVAPWEFVRAQTLRRSPAPSLNSVLPATPAKPKRSTSELTNLTLMNVGMANPSPTHAGAPDTAWALDASPKTWTQLKPAGEDFSVVMPEGGKHVTNSVPYGNEMVDVHVYLVRDGGAVYSTMWMSGPTYGETDRIALNATLEGFLKGSKQGYESTGGAGFSCELEDERNISMNGYTGSEYDMPHCTVPGKVRMFTRLVGGKRTLYGAAVYYWEKDGNISRFLNSFKAGGGKARRSEAAVKSTQ